MNLKIQNPNTENNLSENISNTNSSIFNFKKLKKIPYILAICLYCLVPSQELNSYSINKYTNSFKNLKGYENFQKYTTGSIGKKKETLEEICARIVPVKTKEVKGKKLKIPLFKAKDIKRVLKYENVYTNIIQKYGYKELSPNLIGSFILAETEGKTYQVSKKDANGLLQSTREGAFGEFIQAAFEKNYPMPRNPNCKNHIEDILAMLERGGFLVKPNEIQTPKKLLDIKNGLEYKKKELTEKYKYRHSLISKGIETTIEDGPSTKLYCEQYKSLRGKLNANFRDIETYKNNIVRNKIWNKLIKTKTEFREEILLNIGIFYLGYHQEKQLEQGNKCSFEKSCCIQNAGLNGNPKNPETIKFTKKSKYAFSVLEEYKS